MRGRRLTSSSRQHGRTGNGAWRHAGNRLLRRAQVEDSLLYAATANHKGEHSGVIEREAGLIEEGMKACRHSARMEYVPRTRTTRHATILID